MPVFTAADIPAALEASDLGTYTARLLSDAEKLTLFGAFLETLLPGSASARPHWHAREDELIHVIAGNPTVVEGGRATRLSAGDTATFKAGTPVGHFMCNDTQTEATYLVIGTRSGDDVVTYTDNGDILTVKNGIKTLRNANGDTLKTAPYHGA